MKSAMKVSVAPDLDAEGGEKSDVSFMSPPKSVTKTAKARRLRNLMSVIDGHDDDSFSLDESTRLDIAAKNDPISNASSRRGEDRDDLFGLSERAFRAASCIRWAFLITMLLSAAGLTAATYLALNNGHILSFEREVRTMNHGSRFSR